MSNLATRGRWRSRRLMAQVAFWDLILVLPVSAILYSLKWIDAAYISAIAGIAIAVITGLFAIVSTFIGAAAYDDVNYREND